MASISNLPNETLLNVFSYHLDDTWLFDHTFPAEIHAPHRCYWTQIAERTTPRAVREEYRRLEVLRSELESVCQRWSAIAATFASRALMEATARIETTCVRRFDAFFARNYPNYSILLQWRIAPADKLVDILSVFAHLTHLELPDVIWLTRDMMRETITGLAPYLRHLLHLGTTTPDIDLILESFPLLTSLALHGGYVLPSQPIVSARLEILFIYKCGRRGFEGWSLPTLRCLDIRFDLASSDDFDSRHVPGFRSLLHPVRVLRLHGLFLITLDLDHWAPNLEELAIRLFHSTPFSLPASPSHPLRRLICLNNFALHHLRGSMYSGLSIEIPTGSWDDLLRITPADITRVHDEDNLNGHLELLLGVLDGTVSLVLGSEGMERQICDRNGETYSEWKAKTGKMLNLVEAATEP